MLMMYYKTEEIEEVILKHDFTSKDACQIRKEIMYIINRGSSKVFFDLSGLTAIDRTAAEFLVLCAKIIDDRNGSLAILPPKWPVRLALIIYAKNHFFIFFQSRKNAIKMLKL